MKILWPLTCSFTSLHFSHPLQQASPQQKSEPYHIPEPRKIISPVALNEWGSQGKWREQKNTAVSLWNAWHPIAGNETAKSAAVKANPQGEGGEKQRDR